MVMDDYTIEERTKTGWEEKVTYENINTATRRERKACGIHYNRVSRREFRGCGELGKVGTRNRLARQSVEPGLGYDECENTRFQAGGTQASFGSGENSFCGQSIL